MEKFKHILVAIDFKTETEQAKIDRALLMAKLYPTRITLFSCVEKVTIDPETSVISSEEKQRILLARTENRLQHLIHFFKEKGVENVTYRVKLGDPATEIILQVLRDQHDLLMVSTKASKTLKEHLLGGTTLHLMRKCPCPIWAVKPKAKKCAKIMVAVHFGDDPKQDNHALNRDLLQVGGMMASLRNSELHVINTVPKIKTSQNPQKALALRGQKIKELVKVANLKVSAIPHVVEGDVTTVLPEQVAQQSVDLLVMGMLSRTGILGFFIGNTAEKILSKVNSSVLTVKPKEFVSPIKLEN